MRSPADHLPLDARSGRNQDIPRRAMLGLGVRAGSGLLLTTCGLLTACGPEDRSGSSGRRKVTLAVAAPLSGPLARSGRGIANSVALAVRQANLTRAVPGITFASTALDDRASAGRGKDIAEQLVDLPNVVAVVGTLNSRVAFPMQRPLAAARLAMVSPANTNPALTQGRDWLTGHPVRPTPNYFRTVATDASQGPFAARYARQVLGRRRVFLVEDGEPYGAGLAATFATEFRRLGGIIAARRTIAVGDRTFPGLASRVTASRADIVYCGAAHPECAALTRELKSEVNGLSLMAGDAVFETAYIDAAGASAEGDYVTSVGAPLDRLPSADPFLGKYRIAGYPEPPGPYGAYAYDSAWSVVEAFRSVTADHAGTLPDAPRAAITKALGSVAFTGMTGPVSFDAFGDAASQQLTIYQVRKGAWLPLRTSTFQD